MADSQNRINTRRIIPRSRTRRKPCYKQKQNVSKRHKKNIYVYIYNYDRYPASPEHHTRHNIIRGMKWISPPLPPPPTHTHLNLKNEPMIHMCCASFMVFHILICFFSYS